MAQSSVTENYIRVGILTVSDSCHAGQASDTSGPNLCHLTETLINNGMVVAKAVVPDEETDIKNKLIEWSDKEHLNVIFTTGGTGFAPRDVTPEATKAVLTKEAPGLTIAMLKSSLDVTPMAMLSRSACGIRGNTIVINLPGSKKGSEECFKFVLPALPHAVDLLKGHKQQVADTHKIVQTEESLSKTQGKVPASGVTPAKQIKLTVVSPEQISTQTGQNLQSGIRTRNGGPEKKVEGRPTKYIVIKGLNVKQSDNIIIRHKAPIEKKKQGVNIQSKLWHNTGLTVNELLKRKRGSLNSCQGRSPQNTVESEESGQQSHQSSNNDSNNVIEKPQTSPRVKTQPEKILYQMPRTRAQRKLYVEQNFHETEVSSQTDDIEKSGAMRKENEPNMSLNEGRVEAINTEQDKGSEDNLEENDDDDDNNEVISFTTDMYCDSDMSDLRTIPVDKPHDKNISSSSLQNEKKETTNTQSHPYKGHKTQTVSFKSSCKTLDSDNDNLEPAYVEATNPNPRSRAGDLSSSIYTLTCPTAASDETFRVQDFLSLKQKTAETESNPDSGNKNDSVATDCGGSDFVTDAMSEMEADSAQILYEFSQRCGKSMQNLQTEEAECTRNKQSGSNLSEGAKSTVKRKIKSTKAVRHKTHDSEVSFAQVGESAKIFLQKHPLLRGIYLNKGKREIKRHLIRLKRHKGAIDKGSYLRNGRINDKNRIDDMFEYTEEGKERKDAIDENNARDEYVVNWYMWCPGHGNCLRKCGGYGQCVRDCQGSRHKQDRHNCSLMLNWKLYLSDLEKWQIHITGSHIPLESKVLWTLPSPTYQRLDEDTRDLILKYKDKKDTASIEQMLASKKGIPFGRAVPTSVRIRRFMKNRKNQQLTEKKTGQNIEAERPADLEKCADKSDERGSEEVTIAPAPDIEVVVDDSNQENNSGVAYYGPVPLPINPQVPLSMHSHQSTSMIPTVVPEQDMNVLQSASVPHIQIHHNATGRNIYISADDIVPTCANSQNTVTNQQQILTQQDPVFAGSQSVMPDISGNQLPTGNQLPGTQPGTIIAGQLPQVFPGDQVPLVPQAVQMVPAEFGDLALLFAACQQQQQQQQ